MPCVECSAEKVFSRGMCGACYHRLRRNGSVERKYVRNTGVCSVDGCGKHSFAKNLCAHHYEKAQHPLSYTWRILRSRNPGQYPASWDRLDAFLAAVGDRPSPKHQLRRVNGNLPWGVGNIKWTEPAGKKPQHYTAEEQAAYGREWGLRKRFNLTGADFERMLAEQGGVCAVCHEPETHKLKTGKIKALSVDHDHATGAVRGLLCINCNHGIGRFQDDPARLESAAAYLRRHAHALA